ncbi:NAD(P)H-dependent oxidoreductase, partial [Myxococcota bacterium]|nr:NAD(P)H-dependent oxidoreductase [Myxococcota bacterium]
LLDWVVPFAERLPVLRGIIGFIVVFFLPGFAFRFNKLGFPRKLLSGRTSTIITTMDSPPLLMRTLFFDMSVQVFKHGILNFCGLKVKKVMRIGSVRKSSPARRSTWLNQCSTLGRTWK